MSTTKKPKNAFNKNCTFLVKITPEMEREIDSISRLVCTPQSGKSHSDFKRQLILNGLLSANKKHNKDNYFQCECSYANAVLPQSIDVIKQMHAMDFHIQEMDRKIIGLYSTIDSLSSKLDTILKAINDNPTIVGSIRKGWGK